MLMPCAHVCAFTHRLPICAAGSSHDEQHLAGLLLRQVGQSKAALTCFIQGSGEGGWGASVEGCDGWWQGP
eukprot:15008643-Alexandrium_andersonii.AAC.1